MSYGLSLAHEVASLSDLGAAFETQKMQSNRSLFTSRNELQDLTVAMTKRHMWIR